MAPPPHAAMRAGPRIRWPAAMLVLLVAAHSAQAQSDADAADDGRTAMQKLIDESFEWYELHSGSELETRLKPLPVLRWDNNTRGSVSGLTVLYLADGRPEAVACIYPWQQKLYHEFSSLSAGPLSAHLDGVIVWKTEEPGVSFRAIPEAGLPSDSAAARLRQLRALFRRFEATLVGWRKDNADRQELRRLPRPLYRYKNPPESVIDGAVFGFVMGTDPEVLLVIEAVPGDGEPQWQYAFVRRTSGELEGRLGGAVVWTAARFPNTSDPAKVDRTIGLPLAGLLPAPELQSPAQADGEPEP